MRSLHAVLVDRLSGRTGALRVLELLTAALDGTGPALLPLDAGLPAARLRELLTTFGPDTVEDGDGTSAFRYGGGAPPGRGHGGRRRHLGVDRSAQGRSAAAPRR